MVNENELINTDVMDDPVAIPLSQQIGNLLDAFSNVQEQFTASHERVLHMDRLTQDLLHGLELQEHNYHERARIAKEIMICRQQRRPNKNVVSQNEAIVGFLRSSQGIKMVRLLENLRSLAQKVERSFPGRRYTPRVLTPNEYRNLGKKTVSIQAAKTSQEVQEYDI